MPCTTSVSTTDIRIYYGIHFPSNCSLDVPCLGVGDRQQGRLWAIIGKLRYGFVLTCLVCMWTLLGLVTAWRADVKERSSEVNNEDQQWTFGQVLALAAWAPTIKELILNVSFLLHDFQNQC